MAEFIELNHILENGMPAYPGFRPPRFGASLDHEASRDRYEGKAEFYLGEVEMPTNTGTYLDSPFHRHRDGADLSNIPLKAIAGLPGIVIDANTSANREIPPELLERAGPDLEGRAVLIRTGWDARWGTDDYWEPGPYVGADGADVLVGARPAIVGVDFWNIDDTTDPARPAHTRLLRSNIPIVEHLANLSDLPSTGFRFYAVPPRIVRGANFPVRAFAELAE
ncbi:MAG TPA: cyclase family protein [Actinomycetota bacterium]|nr:cyclase family protein [Actinomycetota bacterium]